MTIDSFEKGYAQAIAISFEEQLSIVYPEGPRLFRVPETDTVNDDKEGNAEAKELLLLRDSMENVVDALPYPSDFDEFKKAITMALKRWKSKPDNNITTNEGKLTKSSTGTGTAFSLFDQLQGGFSMPISLEEIQQAGSAQQRLDIFQKINYMEDLLMDWDKISPMLTDDLSESFLADPNLSLRLIDLHRKWFDQGRSSSEYTFLLYGICENLLRIIADIISFEEPQPIEDASQTNQKIIVISLVQNWRDMWLDLMQRDEYSEDLAGDMEKLMVELFLGPGSCEVSVLAKNVLASADPSATWFQSWANLVPTHDHLLSLLSDSQSDAKILPELWTQIRTFRDIGGRNVDDALCQLHSTAILSITLCRTRIFKFPWDALINSNSTGESFRSVIDETLDFFLYAVVFVAIDELNNTESTRADLIITTVLNGIEAILAGSRNDTDSDVDRRYRKVKSSLEEKTAIRSNTVRHFLDTQLRQ